MEKLLYYAIVEITSYNVATFSDAAKSLLSYCFRLTIYYAVEVKYWRR